MLTAYQLTPELSLDIGTASLVVFVDADVRGLPGAIDVRELSAGAGARRLTSRGCQGRSTPTRVPAPITWARTRCWPWRAS